MVVETAPVANSALALCNTQAQTAEHNQNNNLEAGENFKKTGIEVLIDWLAVTSKEDVETVKARYGSDGWVPLPHGWKGYKQGFVRGGVKIWFDGDADQGVNVQVSGSGCRELEGRGVVTDWVEFLRVQVEAGRFSRLDVAMDDRNTNIEQAIITKENIEAAINESRVVSRYRSVDDRNTRSLTDGKVEGWTRYFGRGMSETMIRCYDKAMQQGVSESYHWMRVELQTRREKAHELARVLVAHGLTGVASVIRGLLDFKERGTHSQRERWESSSWWSAFLGEVGKLRLTVRPLVRTLTEVKNWLIRNVAPLFAVVCAAEKGIHKDFVSRMRFEGERRWEYKHRALLQAA